MVEQHINIFSAFLQLFFPCYLGFEVVLLQLLKPQLHSINADLKRALIIELCLEQVPELTYLG